MYSDIGQSVNVAVMLAVRLALVVASEVRALAQRSAQAAKEIKTLIGASIEKVESGGRQRSGTPDHGRDRAAGAAGRAADRDVVSVFRLA